MKTKVILTLLVTGFVALCGGLVFESGLFAGGDCLGPTCIFLNQPESAEKPQALADPEPNQPDEPTTLRQAPIGFRAKGGEPETVIIGAKDPNIEDTETGYEYQLQLNSKGASIAKATFVEFEEHEFDSDRPLSILRPVGEGPGRIFSMANREFILEDYGQLLRLNALPWDSRGAEQISDTEQRATFDATILTGQGDEFIKLTKSYTVEKGKYHFRCTLKVQNLTDSAQQIRYNMTGPLGLPREAARQDMRKVVAGFRDSEGKVTSNRINIGKLKDAEAIGERTLKHDDDRFLWAAVVNKYFAGIMVPGAEEGADWIKEKSGRYYDPDEIEGSGDETLGVEVQTKVAELAPAGEKGDTKEYSFLVYIGPKDKSIFDDVAIYSQLGFIETIDFRGCCCPANILRPLAFGILGLMNALYAVIPNYGVVIIIFVLFIRLLLHPITKKSQISMQRLSKVAPQIEEIKKKYGDNKQEMNKRIMQLYKEQGSPVMGFLPMLIQMPIWIALYSAIYASIKLRGAAFLPFWITDLSAPDALVRFTGFTIPFFGEIDSLNLLPILMGVAMYFQQKLMSNKATTAANPQAAQQQKIMMIMMPLLLPLFLYKAPAGLNLYIMSSVFAGVVEQYVIRKHIREKEEAEARGKVPATAKTGGKAKKKKTKPFYKHH